jgi:hypothetical protein
MPLHRRRDLAHDARDVDDRRAAAARPRVLDQRARAEEVALHVHLERLVDRGLAGVDHRAEVRVGGGVVDEPVHATEPRDRLLEQRGHLRLLAGVAGERRDPIGVPEARGGRLEVRLLAARDHDLRSGGERARGDRLADPAATSGDDDHLAFQIYAHGSRCYSNP